MPVLRDIIVFDFETLGKTEYGALDIDNLIPASLAAKAYNGRTLEPYKDGEFYSLFYLDPKEEIYEPGLDFIKLTRKELEQAPHAKDVWSQFCDYVKKYNFKKSEWFAPIPAGQNIVKFDLPIVERLNKEYGSKGKDTLLFFKNHVIDLKHLTYFWWENLPDCPKFNLKSVLDYAGIKYKEEELHQAHFDVKYTAEVIMKFMRLHRNLSRKVNWK